ncbi:hypothetical protein CA54_52280 [Symmachiella macrocystis]|uniref:N-acetyltransferase domain-containing protein n=1 Tax=Symmachiella macrocystis TaxID=2527985 RepID=A0A5C6B4G8_9PLAN|nr:N-acetyltransferase [Symmachiella macrocystis]TWU06828.1 hypothetical protein CA54_52280 [Symmachiella macrocystis]
MAIHYREETADDLRAIHQVNTAAFGLPAEGNLVDLLRNDGLAVVSYVAVSNHALVGHILFSELPIETKQTTIPAVALAPMAVLPQFQRQGIGTELVRRGLDICRERGQQVVIVLGHPAYYPRFGFSSELAKRISSPFSDEAFMALELVAGVLDNVQGQVTYPPPFFSV